MREQVRRLTKVIDHLSHWDQLRSIGNSRLVKLTILVPLLGYMILFNEQLVRFLELASPYFRDFLFRSGDQPADTSTWSLAYRLYCFYFGFTALAVGALIYEFRCPRLVKLYGSAAEYFSVEGPTTDRQQWARMLLPRMAEEFRRECQEAGLSVDDVWLDLDAALPKLPEDVRVKAGRIHEKMSYSLGRWQQGADSAKAWIMKEHFVPLKSARPFARWTTFACYTIGFAILAVPTIHSFLSVVLTVVSKLAA
jgi:hypothetical protein